MVKLDLNKKPRKYKTGINEAIIIKDFGNISLKNNEQVTFRFNKQKYDFTKKNWGFYISQSINSRLLNENFKIELIKKKFSKIYLVAVSKFKLVDFKKYCKKDKQKIIIWINEKNL